MTIASSVAQQTARALTSDEVLRIAREDAERVYKDLSRFRISLELEQDGWHIEYRLTKPLVAGGGPHYVIDPMSGVIVSKKYYQ
jgi:hypothetical protein